MRDAVQKTQVKVQETESADLGRPDTLRYNILTFIINEEYERAIRMLKEHIESESEYPNFKMKVERYLVHAIDLIYAIRTKKNFPGIGSLTRTKQQELRDKFKEHFQELRHIMKKIEDSMEELRLSDVRSTSIVIKSFWIGLSVIFVAGFFFEVINGLGHTVEIVFNDYLDQVTQFIISKIF